MDAMPVFFDLETTGRDFETDEIIQIGAVNQQNDVFCRFVLPTKEIPPAASQVNGFTKVNNQLFYRGEPRETTTLAIAFKDFVDYLRQQNLPVVLIGHYCISFDCRFLFRDAKRCRLHAQLQKVVAGFTDSWDLFKEVMPGRSSYKQADLVSEFLGPNMVGHEAVADATALRDIFVKKDLISHIASFYFPFSDVLKEGNKRKAANKQFAAGRRSWSRPYSQPYWRRSY